MKKHIQSLLTAALQRVCEQQKIVLDPWPMIQVERARDRRQGDFATNIAMVLAKLLKRAPREVAQLIVEQLAPSDKLHSVQVAGPGFINFTMTATALQEVVKTILDAGPQYGHNHIGKQQPILIEFVSTNPTGPLHVGHGRGAAYGSAVASLLTASGFDVHREYYVNDAGRQMQILAVSVWLRYLEIAGEVMTFPKNAYQGDYIRDIAKALWADKKSNLVRAIADVFVDVPADEDEYGRGDKEAHIDGLISNAKRLLTSACFDEVRQLALDTIMADIRLDLNHFGVEFEHWFSERSLERSGAVMRCIERLAAQGYVYEAAGARWFKSTELGDDKDRVLVRDNGQSTYFAADIAYHINKFERGFDKMIDVWGSDHHGYVPRVKAALQALGVQADKLSVQLVQFAVLYRGKEKIQMSTRSASYVTLKELFDEVGVDATRFFYVMRKPEQHLDFDLDLAKSQSQDNPVYYIQYAHARICSVLRQMEERGLSLDPDLALQSLALLSLEAERLLLWQLQRYPEVIQTAALQYAPHNLANFLRELATEFHTYYNGCQFLVEDDALRAARVSLIMATRQTLANGLGLLGVRAPEVM